MCSVDGKGLGVFAKRDMKAGERICVCSGYKTDIDHVTAMSLQMDEKVFLHGVGEFDDYINHSCDPNCVVRFENDEAILYVLRDLKTGDELTFDYNTSDWDLIEQGDRTNTDLSFTCRCGTDFCVKEIRGFRHLNQEQKTKRKEYLSPFLLSRFEHP
ncbi:MAG: SET domain-containing methyltransferase [Candidatus Melainabacteria bacterium]|nr:SET domain-containing methyltransferase [Candidatus Melainabacteria bacterium]